MDKYAVGNGIIFFGDIVEGRLKTRLRILWHLWKRESIDSYAFNNTEDILFGMQTMLKNNVYSKEIIEQLEDQTLHYLFPEKDRSNYNTLPQKRYLLLHRLFSFVGDYAGISFAARYSYIEYTEDLTPLEHKELSVLENAVLSFCDFLTSISIKDIKKGNFYLLTK
jgi:hypothetical protein